MFKKSCSWLIVAACAAFVGLHAQDAQGTQAATASPAASPVPVVTEAPGDNARRVVVSAGRVAEDAAVVAANTTVIDAEEIAQSGALTVPDVLQKLAGVGFMGLSSPGDAQISLRGFGENSFGRVLVLVDGVRLNNPDMKGLNWLSVSLDAVERIEVLRGAASAVYGDSAVAGVVNIITNKARKASGASASASLGSNWTNTEALEFFHRGKDVSFGLNARNSGSDGWRNRSAWHTAGVDAALSAALGDRMSLDVAARFSDRSYQMPGTITLAQFGIDSTLATNLSDEASEQTVGGDLDFVWDVADEISIKIPVNYRYGQTASDMVSWTSFQTRWTNTLEARPQANLDLNLGGASLQVQGGFDFRFTDLSWSNYTSLARTTLSGQRVVQQTVAAPWAQSRFGLGEVFFVEAGARYDTAAYLLNSNTRNLDAFVWDVSATVLPLPQLKIWAGFDRVFRYPFTDELASVYSSTLWDLQPETGYNLEGGVGVNLGKGLLDLGASVYWLSLQNEIAWVSDYSNTTDWGANVNLDATERVGVDVTLASAPLEWLNLRANYSFVDARFTAGANAGQEIPLVSAHRAGGAVDFVLPFGVRFGPELSWVSEYYAGSYYSYGSADGNGGKEPGYFLLGAGVDWRLPVDAGEFDLKIQANNLLNSSYYTVAYSYGVYPARGFSLDVILNWKY